MTTALRPLTLGELLDRTFQLYRNNFLLFVGIAATAYFPMFLIRNGVGLFTTYAGRFSTTAVSAVYFGQPITVRGAYSKIMGMIFRVVLVMIGMGIGIMIGTVLLIVPGIILALMWALTIPIV